MNYFESIIAECLHMYYVPTGLKANMFINFLPILCPYGTVEECG
jgi:hypothetical protein